MVVEGIKCLKHETRLWALLLVMVTMLQGCSAAPPAETDTLTVTIGGRTFHLELALDEEARIRGLGGREHIAADGGMLFVFPSPRQTQFVMRDCLVPIDLIFVGPTGEIISMHRMEVEPPETRSNPSRWYRSEGRIQFAIELAGGTLDDLNLRRGQRIELPFESLKARAR